MPAVVILPAVAGFAASGLAAAGVMGATLAAFTATAMGSIVVGAVAGAVVGGLAAAITGGDIMDGVLYGAVGGAVGGYLGGSFTAEEFLGFGSTAPVEGSVTPSAIGSPTVVTEGGEFAMNPAFTKSAEGIVSSGAGAGAGGAGAGGMTSTDMLLYSGISGAAGMFQSGPEAPYASTQAGVTQQLDSQSSMYEAKNETDLEAARIAAAQRERESVRASADNAAALGFKGTELQQSLAQRQQELMTPYQEAAAARERMTNTASSLTTARRAAEQASGTGGFKLPDELAA